MSNIEFKPGSKELARVLHYYGLLQQVDEFKIVCPFHADAEPSMMVSIAKGRFYCFGCSASGDAFTFVKLLHDDKNGLECLKKYFKIIRSKKVKAINFKHNVKQEKEQEGQLVTEAIDYYYNLKTINWEANQSPEKLYMVKRGFFPSTLNKCKAKLTYKDSYPIIFPMLDMGEFKGYVCRATNERIAKKRKYLYNKGFSRKNTLVGNYNAKQVILVEGFMDYLKLKQLGVKHAAAILGWKITAQQIEKLKQQGVEHIISALDNDKCGKRGTRYLRQFFYVTRFRYPKGIKDPGDLTEHQFIKCKKETIKRIRRNEQNGKKEK